MIPEAKKEAVARALREAFGVEEMEDIRQLTAGLSPALVFRIVVRGRPYLLRVIVSTDMAAGPGRGDQTRHYDCMRKGAEAGVGPRVWYANIEDKVSITDFVEARPLARTEALARLPVTVRELHASQPFLPMGSTRYLDVMDGFIKRFLAAKVLPERNTEEMLEGYARVTAIYPHGDENMVSSHNDLKPENILFDGERVWLVDWEAGFLNDRYFDLAVVANFVVTNEAEEEGYLRTYFEEAAGEYRRARFYLMSQILHTSAAVIFLLLGSGGKAIDQSAKVRDFRDFHNGIWAGEISLVSAEAKVEYGRVHLNQVVRNMREGRFEESLRIVRGYD